MINTLIKKLYSFIFFSLALLIFINTNAENIIRNSILSPVSENYFEKIKSCIEKTDLEDKEIILSKVDSFSILDADSSQSTINGIDEGSLISTVRATSSPAAIMMSYVIDKVKGKRPVYFFILEESYFNQLSEKEKEAIIYHEIGHIKYNHLIHRARLTRIIGIGLLVSTGTILYKYWYLGLRKKIINNQIKLALEDLENKVAAQNKFKAEESKEFVKRTLASLGMWVWSVRAASLIVNYQSRKHEYEADAHSFKYVKDVDVFRSLFTRWNNRYKFVKPSQLLFSTHPSPDQRIKAIEDLSKNNKDKNSFLSWIKQAFKLNKEKEKNI